MKNLWCQNNETDKHGTEWHSGKNKIKDKTTLKFKQTWKKLNNM